MTTVSDLFVEGVIIGTLSGMFVLTWIGIGKLQTDAKHPTLPPTSVSQCSDAAANNTLLWQQSSVVADWTTERLYSADRINITQPTIQVLVHISANTFGRLETIQRKVSLGLSRTRCNMTPQKRGFEAVISAEIMQCEPKIIPLWWCHNVGPCTL